MKKKFLMQIKYLKKSFIVFLLSALCCACGQVDGKPVIKDRERIMETISETDSGGNAVSNIHKFGEDIIMPDEKAGGDVNGYSFIVDSARLYPDFADAQINETTFIDCDVYGDQGGYITFDAADKFSYLACSLHIKNLGGDEDLNITSLGLIYVDPVTKEISDISTPCYVSDGSDEEGKRYHINLPVGKEMSLVIGWLVDTGSFPADSLCLCVDDEVDQYIFLNLTK